MNSGRIFFAQLVEHLPHKEFHKCVARYRGDHPNAGLQEISQIDDARSFDRIKTSAFPSDILMCLDCGVRGEYLKRPGAKMGAGDGCRMLAGFDPTVF
jgi:hypothetical protein